MKSYKLLIASTAILTFGMLTACGDGFKSSALDPSQDPGKVIDSGREGAPTGTTDPSVDEQVLDLYASQLSNSDLLADKIVGIDVTLAVETGHNTEDEEYLAEANIMIGTRATIPGEDQDCFVSGIEAEPSRSGVTKDELTSMEPVELGNFGNIGATLHCTKDDCSEMVLAVTESNRSTALYGMRRVSVGSEVEKLFTDICRELLLIVLDSQCLIFTKTETSLWVFIVS